MVFLSIFSLLLWVMLGEAVRNLVIAFARLEAKKSESSLRRIPRYVYWLTGPVLFCYAILVR